MQLEPLFRNTCGREFRRLESKDPDPEHSLCNRRGRRATS